MAKTHDKYPDGKNKPLQPAGQVRRNARQGAQKRKLLQKHYNNKYHVR